MQRRVFVCGGLGGPLLWSAAAGDETPTPSTDENPVPETALQPAAEDALMLLARDRFGHRYNPEQLASIGRQLERQRRMAAVLARYTLRNDEPPILYPSTLFEAHP